MNDQTRKERKPALRNLMARAIEAYDDERSTGLGDYEHEADVLLAKMHEQGIVALPAHEGKAGHLTAQTHIAAVALEPDLCPDCELVL
jgi:hypothetical protein